ncbi:hypothetical protein K2173_001439 [Erythroxylum novogranatense]|uniref:Uncharacterized protein n=1 Tax=Erythroxylum novogranatense TaxID=1862640 RepID=A0AAV8T925_9ROSI|nr:hypothetical protein K2173_001439 [Erythroxylum novogranatense]
MSDTARSRSSSGMATATRGQRQPSKLQQRRPTSLKITPVSSSSSHWNVAIPLLSPLNTSPTAVELNYRQDPPVPAQKAAGTMVFKKWQHPAAPFCCESAPMFFVPT